MNEEAREILRIQQFFRSVQDAAVRAGGVLVSRFSQSHGAVNALIGTDKATRHGICQALTNRWIACHANEGSMWNDLCTAEGYFKISEIKLLMEEFKQGTKSGIFSHWGIQNPQKWNAEKYLFRHGVIRRQGITSGLRLYSESGTNGSPDINIGQAIAQDFKLGPRNGYRMISIKSKSGGHVFCAWVGGSRNSSGDVAFFDSNFGDFWFDSIDKFAPWYDWTWRRLYGGTYGAYQIRDFGAKAGHVKKMVKKSLGTI